MSSLRTEIFEAIGEASMCWTETPSGIFDSQRAEKIAFRIEDKVTEIERKLEIAVRALKFYANRNNFENGQIVSSDIEPAVRIEGRVIHHYSSPPTETQTWVGGTQAREALAEIEGKK